MFNNAGAVESSATGSASPSPVLVELFTSEGCSSCPPADALLEEWDGSQPVPGARVIALSEHVDYWDHEGWKDPYSSILFTDRQREYDRRFGVNVYTPQMIIDGAAQCNGSDVRSASRALAQARDHSKIGVRISRASLEDSTTLRARVETDPLPRSSHGHKANIYVVVALDHAESQVLGGENKGRRISHVAVAERVNRIGCRGAIEAQACCPALWFAFGRVRTGIGWRGTRDFASRSFRERRAIRTHFKEGSGAAGSLSR